ncbi:MAG: hypothetical protein V7K30_10935 [Nostoc sp.]
MLLINLGSNPHKAKPQQSMSILTWCNYGQQCQRSREKLRWELKKILAQGVEHE